MTRSIEVPPDKNPLVRIASRSGKVEIHATADNVVSIDSEGTLEPGAVPGVFVAKAASPSEGLVLRCPEGCDLIIGTSSGKVELHGRLGNIHVTTTSGDVRLENAARADLRLASGKAQVGSCGTLRVQSASGDVRVGTCGNVDVMVVNGKIEVGDAGRLHARTTNGSVSVTVRGDAFIETISGKVRVAVAGGMHPKVRQRTLNGKTRNDCPAGQDLEISVRTVNGDIEVVSA